MPKVIEITSCLMCPFYKEENNVYRNGTVGYVSTCNSLGKEIAFTDKGDTPPEIYDKPYRECTLNNY